MARCSRCGTTSGGRSLLERLLRNEQWWFRGPGYSPRIQAHLLRREGKVVRVDGAWIPTELGRKALACVHRYHPQPPSAAVRRGEPRGRLARVVPIVPTPREVPGRVGRAWRREAP